MNTKARPRVIVRNPVARTPILRKGGLHGKTRKALRAASKVTLRKEFDAVP